MRRTAHDRSVARRALVALPVFAALPVHAAAPRIGVLVEGGGGSHRILPRLPAMLLAVGLRDAELDVVAVEAGRFDAAAASLAGRRPQVVISAGSPASVAIHRAAPDVPLIVIGSDPIALGMARSMAQPGGMVTGFSILSLELDAKRLELLAEMVPGAAPLGALVLEGAPLGEAQASAFAQAAGRAQRQLMMREALSETVASAFSGFAAAGAGGLVVASSPRFSAIANRLAALGLHHRLPMACQWRAMAEAGCLFSYGPDLHAIWQRAVEMAAMIFRGTPPGRIPLEQPTRFELVINLVTAGRLGIEIPDLLLARADGLIE